MKKEEKRFYEVPSALIVEVRTEEVVCVVGSNEKFSVAGNSYDDSDFD